MQCHRVGFGACLVRMGLRGNAKGTEEHSKGYTNADLYLLGQWRF